MNEFSVSIAPFFPTYVTVLLGLTAGLLALYGVYHRLRGAWIRLVAVLALLAALLNPALLEEDREPLKTIVAVVVDESDSQKFDDRNTQTVAALKALKDRFSKLPQFELREITARNGGAETADASTALFTALKSGLKDVPVNQIGGVIMLTDGQVHDVPQQVSDLGFTAPVHALLTGDKDDKDRRILIKKAPRFGIVGESQEITYSIVDAGSETDGNLAEVQISIDGELKAVEQVLPGEDTSFFFEIPHGGKNVIEFNVRNLEGEITTDNNSAFTVMEGIRENLRVLLVSGEPHAGERTWRNLLKSDASVDLVHFTILRPPEKQDGTPINQLSLIAFPTRELFIEKIDEFDLIIFDRYQRRGVLPVLYFDNIARYMSDGGAILIAAGPEHADIASIHQTPLATVLPVEPTGDVLEAPYHPQVSDEGRRHPVTRDLDGIPTPGSGDDPKWSRWFRLIQGRNAKGNSIMQHKDGSPLLVLNREGEGRIAMLMSDHVWLWARGFEGGGPHTQLLRRLAHWLMKEPELDEEALTANAKGNTLSIQRQTMGEEPGTLEIETPSGEKIPLQFTENGDGSYVATHDAQSLGLFRVRNGELTALANVGPTNPKEFAAIVSTDALLAPVAKQTGGSIHRIAKTNPERSLPRILGVRTNSPTAGSGWIGLHTTNASVLKGINQIPLFSGFLGLAVLLMVFAGMWAREGR